MIGIEAGRARIADDGDANMDGTGDTFVACLAFTSSATSFAESRGNFTRREWLITIGNLV